MSRPISGISQLMQKSSFLRPPRPSFFSTDFYPGDRLYLRTVTHRELRFSWRVRLSQSLGMGRHLFYGPYKRESRFFYGSPICYKFLSRIGLIIFDTWFHFRIRLFICGPRSGKTRLWLFETVIDKRFFHYMVALKQIMVFLYSEEIGCC